MKRRHLSISIAAAVILLGIAILVSSRCPGPTPSPSADAAPDAPAPAPGADAGPGTTLTLANDTPQDTIAFVAFGADSAVRPSDWPLCGVDAGLACQFPIKARASLPLPLASRYLNATIAFGAPVGCGATKAELNLNNPKWYDTLDVSLVDGFSNGILITITSPLTDAAAVKLGPPNGPKDNEKVFGLFPLGCDICTAQKSPPCGIVPGGPGCKAGTQFKPDVPCQYQGAAMGGGAAHVTVSLVGIPLK